MLDPSFVEDRHGFKGKCVSFFYNFLFFYKHYLYPLYFAYDLEKACSLQNVTSLLLLLLIIAELRGRHRQSPIVLGGEDQSLGIKDTLSIGPVDTHSRWQLCVKL